MNARVRAEDRGHGHGARRFAALAIAVGAVSIAAAFALGLSGLAFAALAAAWLFFAGIAAGAVAVAAAVRVAGGRWAAETEPAIRAVRGFFFPALVVLAALVFGARAWIPEAAAPGRLGFVLLVARQILATAALFALGGAFLGANHGEGSASPRAGRLAVGYLILYAVTLSTWAIDLAMGSSVKTPSTVIPAFYFVGAFLSGVAWIAWTGGTGRVAMGPRTRRDLSKMLFGFGGFWVYLVWAAFLPVWYGNLPDETSQLLTRWTGGWRFITMGVMASVFGAPFVLFFPEGSRFGPAPIKVGAAVVLVGLLGEGFLLILPPLDLRGGALAFLLSGGIALGVLGLFLLAVGGRLSEEVRSPATPGRP